MVSCKCRSADSHSIMLRASSAVAARVFARTPRRVVERARRRVVVVIPAMSAQNDGPVKSNAKDFANDDGTSTNWEAMWSNGIGKGQAFDATRTEPGFQAMLDAGECAIGGGRALVPGCGRGYALASLARAGFRDVVGLEISETAKAACEAQLDEETIPGDAKVEVRVSDFFEHGSKGEEKYDLVYDCTFLCAIDPSRRKEWADVYARCVKPGGTLVSLVFPCGDFEGGPPYALKPEIVRELLEPVGFEAVSLAEVPEELYARGRLEYLYVWRKL